ncbi:MAG TPA: response regulator transcription factor [Chitinophagales bacterium]|nr:response regulator transcription factor [Chitinophagales bacterium]MCB0511997.1 response regulator transcription factor [Bacteroidota bacterium]MCB9075775.1 response regulator transcription factor [Chitinophagales bacterium]HMU97908.1 response regulator transcription factor [Chitinophagales bacterium]HMV02710.1 response regulator transcription factor [Chitinophagales bacterium]
MNEKKILLVEDDFLNRRLSKKIFIENNYHVLEAKNTKEALEILKTETVNCAILDINLGKKEADGISLGKQIYENFSIPFIYLTAYETTEIIEKAVATSPYSYLTKPFKNSDLIASVEIAIRKFKNTKQQQTIVVKDGEYNVALPLEKINYIESNKNYLLFHTNEKTYKTRSTIKKTMKELPDAVFVQIHRAFIINKNKVEKYTRKSVIINNNEIPVSFSLKEFQYL